MLSFVPGKINSITMNKDEILADLNAELQQINDLIAQEPDDIHTYFSKLGILKAINRRTPVPSELLDCWERIVTLTYTDKFNSEEGEAIEASCYKDRGRYVYKVGLYKIAAFWFDKAIELRPNDAELYHFKAMSLFKWGNQCIDLSQNVKFEHSKQHLQDAISKHTEARECINLALEKEPDNPWFQINKARIMYHTTPTRYVSLRSFITNKDAAS